METTSAGQSPGMAPWGIIIVGAAIVAAVTVYRLGFGKGPAVNWFPRSMRSSVNRAFRRRGWSEPYDDTGNKRPRSERR